MTTQTKPNPHQADRDYPDFETELIQRALHHAFRHRRGSRSPAYDACTKYFIYFLAKEILSLARTHGRPDTHIAETATKAISAIQAALAEIEDATH
jgi:hypothetical protein